MSNIIIRMGASKFTADVRGADGTFVHFNLNKLAKDPKANARALHNFRRELTKAFRISREGN